MDLKGVAKEFINFANYLGIYAVYRTALRRISVELTGAGTHFVMPRRHLGVPSPRIPMRICKEGQHFARQFCSEMGYGRTPVSTDLLQNCCEGSHLPCTSLNFLPGPQIQWGGREGGNRKGTSKEGCGRWVGTRGGTREVHLSEAKVEPTEVGTQLTAPTGTRAEFSGTDSPKTEPSLRGEGRRR